MPALVASRGDAKRCGWPFTRISPSNWSINPAAIFIRVDLPAPFSPISAWISPARSSKSTFLKTGVGPKLLEIPRICRADGFVASVCSVGATIKSGGQSTNIEGTRIRRNQSYSAVPDNRFGIAATEMGEQNVKLYIEL